MSLSPLQISPLWGIGWKEKPRTPACSAAGQRGVSWRDCCSGSRRLSAAGQIYDNCRYGQGQIASAWKESVSTPGGCVWTCDLISEQACPCQPEPCRHRACPAAPRPGARELQGFQLLLTAVFVLLLPALSAAVVRQMAQTCCPYVHGCGWRSERAGAGPSLLVPLMQARREGDGWCCSLSLLLSFTKPPKGWVLHSCLCRNVPWATGRGGCARRAGFPSLWGCLHTMKKNVLWKQQLSLSGDDAVPSTTKEPIPCHHWIRWAGGMSRMMKCSVLQT